MCVRTLPFDGVTQSSGLQVIAHALPEHKGSQCTYDIPKALAYHENLCISLLARHSVSLHLRALLY